METKKHSPAGYEPLQSHDDNTEIEDYHKDSRNFVDTKIFIDSFESEKLQKLIADKKEYLSKQKNDFARKKLQEEIMFLENSVLPIVLNETTILYNDSNRYLTQKLRQAIDMRCDALLLLVPLREDIPQRYVVGIANPRELTPYGNVDEFDIAIERINTDVPINVINLPL
ncbi:hypothetical protein C0T31_07820 [Dysgonamonadaceae bacterium]|nr:hypothetical protein C0T31_07820 [Dysgonamonadaceae bacterium]